jgi:hypothetical protein
MRPPIHVPKQRTYLESRFSVILGMIRMIDKNGRIVRKENGTMPWAYPVIVTRIKPRAKVLGSIAFVPGILLKSPPESIFLFMINKPFTRYHHMKFLVRMMVKKVIYKVSGVLRIIWKHVITNRNNKINSHRKIGNFSKTHVPNNSS